MPSSWPGSGWPDVGAGQGQAREQPGMEADDAPAAERVDLRVPAPTPCGLVGSASRAERTSAGAKIAMGGQVQVAMPRGLLAERLLGGLAAGSASSTGASGSDLLERLVAPLGSHRRSRATRRTGPRPRPEAGRPRGWRLGRSLAPGVAAVSRRLRPAATRAAIRGLRASGHPRPSPLGEPSGGTGHQDDGDGPLLDQVRPRLPCPAGRPAAAGPAPRRARPAPSPPPPGAAPAAARPADAAATAGRSEPPAATRRLSDRQPALDGGGNRRHRPQVEPRDRPIAAGPRRRAGDAPASSSPLPSGGGLKWVYSRKSIRAASRGRAACTWAGLASPRLRGAERGALAGQLRLELLLARVSSAIFCLQAGELLGIGRGQGEGGQLAGGGLQRRRAAGPLGVVGLAGGRAAWSRSVPLAFEDGPLPGQDMAIGSVGRDLASWASDR